MNGSTLASNRSPTTTWLQGKRTSRIDPTISLSNPTTSTTQSNQEPSQPSASQSMSTGPESQLRALCLPGDQLSAASHTVPPSASQPCSLSTQSSYQFNQPLSSTQPSSEAAQSSSPSTQPVVQCTSISQSKLSSTSTQEDQELSDSSSSLNRTPSPIPLTAVPQLANPVDLKDTDSDDLLPMQSTNIIDTSNQLTKPVVIPFDAIKSSMTVRFLPFAPVVVKSKSLGLAFLSSVIPPKGFE